LKLLKVSFKLITFWIHKFYFWLFKIDQFLL